MAYANVRIPGIHWPYADQAGKAFGGPFALHLEDHWLLSINYLYVGEKVWVVVAPEHATLLETKLRATNGSYYISNCAQFLRHSATYVLTSTLNDWNISHSIVHQMSHEAVSTFPQAYHKGFRVGYAFAEAVIVYQARPARHRHDPIRSHSKHFLYFLYKLLYKSGMSFMRSSMIIDLIDRIISDT